MKCSDHTHRSAIPEDVRAPSCPNCGRLFYTVECSGCRRRFLKYGDGHDSVAGYATYCLDGTVRCGPCAQRADQRHRSVTDA